MHTNSVSGIYALCCPDTGEVRYIGQSKNIRSRFYGHCRGDSHLPVSRWVKSLKNSGERPVLNILEETEDLDAREIEWISHYGLENLLNLHGGGRNPAFAGNGKTSCITSVKGVPNPYTMLIRALWRFTNNRSGKVIHNRWRKAYHECNTEEERINFQLQAFVAAHRLLKADQQVLLERWAIKAAPAINRKYPGRLTLVYNDGVEETP